MHYSLLVEVEAVASSDLAASADLAALIDSANLALAALTASALVAWSFQYLVLSSFLQCQALHVLWCFAPKYEREFQALTLTVFLQS